MCSDCEDCNDCGARISAFTSNHTCRKEDWDRHTPIREARQKALKDALERKERAELARLKMKYEGNSDDSYLKVCKHYREPSTCRDCAAECVVSDLCNQIRLLETERDQLKAERDQLKAELEDRKDSYSFCVDQRMKLQAERDKYKEAFKQLLSKFWSGS